MDSCFDRVDNSEAEIKLNPGTIAAMRFVLYMTLVETLFIVCIRIKVI